MTTETGILISIQDYVIDMALSEIMKYSQPDCETIWHRIQSIKIVSQEKIRRLYPNIYEVPRSILMKCSAYYEKYFFNSLNYIAKKKENEEVNLDEITKNICGVYKENRFGIAPFKILYLKEVMTTKFYNKVEVLLNKIKQFIYKLFLCVFGKREAIRKANLFIYSITTHSQYLDFNDVDDFIFWVNEMLKI